MYRYFFLSILPPGAGGNLFFFSFPIGLFVKFDKRNIEQGAKELPGMFPQPGVQREKGFITLAAQTIYIPSRVVSKDHSLFTNPSSRKRKPKRITPQPPTPPPPHHQQQPTVQNQGGFPKIRYVFPQSSNVSLNLNSFQKSGMVTENHSEGFRKSFKVSHNQDRLPKIMKDFP